METNTSIDQSTGIVASERPQRSRLAQICIKTAINVLPYWWVLILAFATSAGTSIYLSDKLATTSHKVGAALIYHPLPIDGGADRLYFPPDLKTLSSLVNSAPVLQQAITASKAPLSPRILSQNLVVIEPKNTKRIGLMLTTDDPEQGRRTLSAVCTTAQNYIADMRRDVIGNTLEDLRTSLDRNNRRMRSGREALMNFTGRLKIDDVETELTQLADELATLDYQRNRSEIEEKGLRLQHSIVAKQLSDQKKQAEEEAAAAEDDDEGAQESLNDARRRQDRLNELIREERRLNEVRAALDARQNVFERKIKLYEKGYISRSDFEAIESEVKELQAQIMEGPKIDAWQTELDRLDKQIVPKAGKKPVVSPIIHQIMFRMLELDLGVNNAQEVQRQIAFKQVDARKRRQELRLFQQEQSGLMLEIKAANDERDTLNRQISSLTSLHEMGPSELTIADAPSSVMLVPSSNRKKIFAGLFLGISVLMTFPVLTIAAVTAARPTVLEHSQELDLAVLSPRKSLSELMKERRSNRGVSWERQVALRIQQLIPQRGSVVSLLPATGREDDDQIVRKMAEILQFREERVLIIRLGNPPIRKSETRGTRLLNTIAEAIGRPLPTLADYLVNKDVSVDDTVSGMAGGIEIVHGGDYHPEMIFSQRMSEYLRTASQKYSIVLVYGMELSETTSVEMLAGHSHGLILLHDRTDFLSGDVKRTIDNLCEIQAPVFGIAMRPPERKLPRFRRMAKKSVQRGAKSEHVEDTVVKATESKTAEIDADAVVEALSDGEKVS